MSLHDLAIHLAARLSWTVIGNWSNVVLMPDRFIQSPRRYRSHGSSGCLAVPLLSRPMVRLTKLLKGMSLNSEPHQKLNCVGSKLPLNSSLNRLTPSSAPSPTQPC